MNVHHGDLVVAPVYRATRAILVTADKMARILGSGVKATTKRISSTTGNHRDDVVQCRAIQNADQVAKATKGSPFKRQAGATSISVLGGVFQSLLDS
jgi:hypothetical protein